MKNKTYADLHLHTTYSDGLDEPKGLIRNLSNVGLDVVAITDHDITSGYYEALNEAKKYGLTLIPGVEISTKDYDILGLNINPRNFQLQRLLSRIRTNQKDSCAKRIENFRNLGFPITLEKLVREFPKSRLGRYNIFLTLLADEKCRKKLKSLHPDLDSSGIFHHYLGHNGLAYQIENGDEVSSVEAIDSIHQAGGIAIIAHPFKQIKPEKLEEKMGELLEEGLDGLEIQPNYNEKNMPFAEYAKKKGLLVSYGSDFHGAGFVRPLLRRGENVLGDKIKMSLGIGS